MSHKLQDGEITAFRAAAALAADQERRRSEVIVSELCSVVPASLRVWLGEGGREVAENLLKYGSSSRKYRLDEGSL